jgi:phosphomannomutase
MKKVELQLKINPEQEIIVDDVFGKPINLGVNPRLLFGGEESGGMVMGTEDLIQSQHGRKAIAMREKSATEAIVVASALVSKLEQVNMSLSEYLLKVFDENSIIGRFDTRVDIAYYNESEPDINKLKQAKIEGEAMRTKNDMFYLSMAIANRKGYITVEQIIEILNDKFSSEGLSFDNLKSVKFVGDGTYLQFEDKYIEIRPSGTDAKTKAYGGGLSKEDINLYANILGNYSGVRTEMHEKLISNDMYDNCKDYAMEYYLSFVDKGANNEPFLIPEYSF